MFGPSISRNHRKDSKREDDPNKPKINSFNDVQDLENINSHNKGEPVFLVFLIDAETIN